MKPLPVLPLCFLALLCSQALAAPKWEICLDKADFTFSLDGFYGSTTVTKAGCRVRFAVSGGKGERYEFDLCDPFIHIDHYEAIDATEYHRVVAGSAGCPAPLFGADFSENARSYTEYREARQRLFGYFEKIKGVYGEGAEKVNLSDPASFSPEVSAGKIACGQFLLTEYLSNCLAFEEKKKDASKEPEKPALKGVHPQTILVPIPRK